MEANIKNYSPEQQAVIDFKVAGTGNALVSSVAGSGKTSLLFGVLAASSARESVAVCAYGRKIANEFVNKYSGIKETIAARTFINTVHGFGRASIIKTSPRVKLALGKDKTPEVLDGQTKIDFLMEKAQVPAQLKTFVAKAYDLARQAGAGVLPEFPFSRQEAWWNLVEHFDLRDCFEDAEGNLPDNVDKLLREAINHVVRIIKAGVEMSSTVIDFEDMVYIPLRKNLPTWTYDLVLVDEAQDTNPTKRAYIKRMLKPGGRAFFVGDPQQAIFGFTGADAKSFENIKAEFGCKVFDLTWSFRCSKAAVRLAQTWVNHIQSAANAPEGEERTIASTDLYKENLTKDDAIVCRNNAPLVDLFFDLLKRGIASHIEGKDIGRGLVAIIDRYPKLKTLVALETKLENWAARATLKAQQAGREEKAGMINDQVQCILAVSRSLAPNAMVSDLRHKIYSMFQDENGEKLETLTLTSSHKSKGREWNRVFWWGPNRYNPSPYARQDWQMEQENNLCYVTATRAKESIIQVTVPAR